MYDSGLKRNYVLIKQNTYTCVKKLREGNERVFH